jgi:hypothetical protein
MINIYEEGDKVYYIDYNKETNVVEIKSGTVLETWIPGDVQLVDTTFVISTGEAYNSSRTLDIHSVFASKDQAMQHVLYEAKYLSLKLAIAELKELKEEARVIEHQFTAYSLCRDEYYRKLRWI